MLTLEGQTKWIQAEMCETHGNEYITQIHESFLKYCRSLTLVSTKERISVCRRCSVCQTAIMTVILTAYNASNLSALAAAKRKIFHRCFCCIRLFSVRPRKTLEQCEWKIERYIHIYFPIEFCVRNGGKSGDTAFECISRSSDAVFSSSSSFYGS